ncbi:MAG TPA: OmpA family protein [Caulobacteraceae bacterium]|nr:OmpA family protein [Caulobacteraceae bacterium]
MHPATTTFRGMLLASCVAAIAAAPVAAKAQQPVQGPYISIGAGANILMNEHLPDATGAAANAAFGSNLGPAVVVGLGYGLGNGLRAEIEGDYRKNWFSEGKDLGFPASVGGSEVKYGVMVNVLYDFTGLTPYVTPYAGLGIGYQWAHLSGFHVTGTPGGFPSITSDDTQGALAYQAILGLAAPIQAVPGLALTLEYRFLGLTDRDYNVTTVAAAGAPAASGKLKFGNDFNHSVLLGVRYNFGQSAPPPPPAPTPVAAPAPAPTRSYLVFFDWDKASLTDRARQIIREAADNSTRVQYTRIEVNGYTDTSGTPHYNQGLSVRRAQAVAGELVRDGVPRNAISIQGFGETHLLVPTGPGVREPQNRRVEIIIR